MGLFKFNKKGEYAENDEKSINERSSKSALPG